MKATLIRLPTTFFLMVVALGVCPPSLCGQGSNWTQTGAPITNWVCVAASAAGTTLVAAAFGDGIYTSTNSGGTWTQTSAPTTNWECVASSADGSKLVAAASGGGIYTSTNSGATWAQASAPADLDWLSAASSADGTKLVAAAFGGIYTSTSSGATWTQTGAPAVDWRSVASSADGTKLVALVQGGGIYTSTNTGAKWTQTSAPAGLDWLSVASSADGTKLAAAAFGDGIYTSTNAGATWTQTSAPDAAWESVASSADGSKLAAAVAEGGIYGSTNGGVTWTQASAPADLDWRSVASSADGSRLVAVVFDGGIYADIMPWITQQPASVWSCPGSSPAFGVTAGGIPPLGFQWRKNQSNLVDGGNVTGAATTNLTLLNVSPSDTANYDVVVSDACGSITSSVATLTVTPAVPASATPIVANGFIIGATLLEGGCGYTSPPAINFSGQGGSGAAAYAQISNGTVTNIWVSSAGFNYPTNTLLVVGPPIYPTVGITRSFSNPPPATATAVITNGFVIGANLTAGGSDYTEAPTVSFSDVSGSGAMAYAQITNGSVVNIVITNAGSGYSSNTVISISPPARLSVLTPNASNLIAGQTYQFSAANDLINWTNYGPAFMATNATWTSTNIWNTAITNQMFFRLQMFQ